jgi:hypothetical protein
MSGAKHMQIKCGATRVVLLIWKYAVKIPTFYSWKLFLNGLLANLQEIEWSGFDDFLCPVLFGCPGGWFLVMPRVATFRGAIKRKLFTTMTKKDGYTLPAENKPGHFGLLNGKLVTVDYGS